MSHPVAAPASAPPATAPAAVPTSSSPAVGSSGSAAASAGHVDTPSLLNRWQIIGMSVAVVFGLLSALLQVAGWQADGRAAADTEQLTRVQGIQSSLLQADALATNSFLAAGIVDDDDQQQRYDDAVDDVLARIVAAADAQPADREALAALNEEVNAYASAVAVARAYNRQGYPVGAEYLSGASDRLRDRAQPILVNLVEANTDRAEDAMGGHHPWLLLLVGLLGLGGLVVINQLLARTFHRRINRGVAVAVVLVLLTTFAASVAAFRGAGQNDDLRTEELAGATAQAAARTAANDAKAYESLRLIKRGSGSLYEDPWTDAAATVEEQSAPALLDDWQTYAQRHEQIVRWDEQDLWFRAVRLAVDPGEDGSTAPLEEFDAASEAMVDDLASTATDELRSGRTLALIGALLTVLIGVAAAIAVARGVGARRKEYA